MDAIATSGHTNQALAQATSEDAYFWYSRRTALLLALFLLLIAYTHSAIVPPLQSPDEPEHLKRAYLLSRGHIFLASHDGVTGGYIDTGLLAYMESFDELRFQYDHKLTSSLAQRTNLIRWTGEGQFRGFPNTAFYFPAPYLPQAVAFVIGQRANLNVSQSYYLARTLSLLVTIGLLLCALLVYPMPLFVMAIFLTPMTLFQLSAASLDSISFALTALAAALFMRGASARFSFDARMHAALIVCLFCLATSRVALFGLTPLPIALYATRRSRSFLISGAGLICLSSAWIIYALETVKGALSRDITTLQIIEYYASAPWTFVRVLFDTITDGNELLGYWRTLIGVLGWLDTPLGSNVYAGFGVLYGLLTLLVIGRRPRLENGSLWLTGAAVCSLGIMYFVFLVVYNPHPAKTIEGIQGRYFIPILILISYAIFSKPLAAPRLKTGLILLALLTALSVTEALPRLLTRYWLT